MIRPEDAQVGDLVGVFRYPGTRSEAWAGVFRSPIRGPAPPDGGSGDVPMPGCAQVSAVDLERETTKT
jgi:hypothetical protein